MAAELLYFFDAKVWGALTEFQSIFPNAPDIPAIASTGSRYDNGRVFQTNNGSSSTNVSVWPWTGERFDTGNILTNYVDGAVQFGLSSINTAMDGTAVTVADGTTAHLTLVISLGAKAISLRRGTSTGTSLTGDIAVPVLNNNANVWNNIAFSWTIDDSVGSATVTINEVTYVSITNVDTRNGAAAQWNRIALAASTTNSISPQGRILTDHIHIWHLNSSALSTLPINPKIVTGFPTGDNSIQFTPNSGATNFSRVNHVSDGDTSYNSSSTAGHVDRFDVSGTWIPSTASAVHGLHVLRTSRIDDATPRTVRNKIWSSGVVADGPAVSENSSYLGGFARFDIDPNTAAAWTVANAQVIDIGYELVT